MSRTVEVRVAGQNYRVVSSAPEAEVRRLAEAVNAKLAELVPKGRAAPPHALLLAAIALAHDVEEEREKRESMELRARDWLQRVVARIDEVLEAPEDGEGAGVRAGAPAAGGDEHEAPAGGGDEHEALAGGGVEHEARAGDGDEHEALAGGGVNDRTRVAGGVDDHARAASARGDEAPAAASSGSEGAKAGSNEVSRET